MQCQNAPVRPATPVRRRRPTTTINTAATAAALALAIVSATTSATAAVTSVTVFGDSLSDSGNAFIASGGAFPPAPYAMRFSNGPVYAEQLAGHLGLDASASLGGGSNFAYGVARTASNPMFGDAGSLLGQIDAFATATGGSADPTGLHLLWIGGNDLRDALETGSPAAATTIVTEALGTVGASIAQLKAMGAGQIMVADLPDLALVPAIAELGDPAASGFASLLSANWNAGLASVVGSFGDPDVELFEISDLFADVVTNPSAYGFTNTTGQAIAADPADWDRHVFWDGLHATEAMHGVIADAMCDSIDGCHVPEPLGSTLFAMTAGLMLLRRRR